MTPEERDEINRRLHKYDGCARFKKQLLAVRDALSDAKLGSLTIDNDSGRWVVRFFVDGVGHAYLDKDASRDLAEHLFHHAKVWALERRRETEKEMEEL